MSKKILFCILLIVLPVSYSFAQSGTDPLHWTKPIQVKGENIFVLGSQFDASGSPGVMRSYQRIFRYDTLETNNLSSTALHGGVDTVSGNGQVDVAAGYFQKDDFEDAVAAWQGPNRTIRVMISHFDSTANMWSATSEMTVPGPVVPFYPIANSSTKERGRIYVKTGHFLGNGLDQFALAYEGADSLIHIQVYSVDNNLNPHLLASVKNDSYDINPPWAKFSIATGDLNGDGIDEIILNGLDINGDYAQVYTKIYELKNSSLASEAKIDDQHPFLISGQTGVTAVNFGSSIGHFKGGSSNEIGLSIVTYKSHYQDANADVLVLSASSDLKNLSLSVEYGALVPGTSSYNGAFSVASGDLIGNGRDELVIADHGSLFDFGYAASTGNAFINMLKANFSSERYDDVVTYDYLGVGDLDQSGHADIVVVKGNWWDTSNGSNVWTNSKEGYDIVGYSVSSDFKTTKTLFDLKQFPTGYEFEPNSLFHYAIALGTFNGDDFKLGAPQHFVENDIIQPLVVLNSPPIHYDILNGTTYDLSGCFSGSGCGFYSNYEQQTSTSVNLQSQTHNDVSGSHGLDISGSVGFSAQESVAPFGVGVQISESISTNFETKLEHTYGHSFSSKNSSAQTTALTIGVKADGIDQIYATTSKYNVWEYPVYDGSDPNPIDYENFISPDTTTGRWYSSSTYQTTNFAPVHEVGNILSYPTYKEALHNPDIDSMIVSPSTGFDISNKGGDHWDLDISKYRQSSLDTTWHSGHIRNINVGYQNKKIIDNVHMNTVTTSISKGFDLRATFGGLIDTLSGADYTVTPYAYRSKEGAIVIDYAVDPDVASNGTQTWWQKEYGHDPDPTFILPWFYDQHASNVKQEQTADIFYSQTNPSPGDTLTITARVRNFSLVDTPTPVSVRFYIGDPNNGGIPMVSTNGDTVVTTTGAVAARTYADARFHWRVPSSMPANILYNGDNVHIYAVIDPENKITEIHKNNDTGWSDLVVPGVATAIEKNPNSQLPTTVKLYPNYPNPFNPTTTIHYVLPKAGNVKLTVYNILGQRVAQLINSRQTAGNHEVRFNASQLSSGVYFYRLRTNSTVKTGKMMLIK